MGVFLHLRNELPHKIFLSLISNTLFLKPSPTVASSEDLHTARISIKKQKKALRIISNSPTHCHTSPISSNLGIQNIYQHIQHHALIFMFQQQNN